MNRHQLIAIEALEQMKSEDLARCRWAFRNHTPEQMQEEYGNSGDSCAEVLAGYQRADAKIQAAINWVSPRNEEKVLGRASTCC